MTSRHTWSFVGGAGGGQECYDGQDDGYGVSEVSSRVEACQEQPQRSAAAGGRWQPMGRDSTDGARAWTPPPPWSTHPHIAKPTFLAPTQFRSHPPRPVQVRDYFKVRPFRCDGKQLKFCHLQVGLKFKQAITQNFPKTSFVNKQLSRVLLFFKYFCRLCEINICGMQSPG